MIDDVPEPPPPCPKGQVRIRVKQVESKMSPGSANTTPSRQLRPVTSTPMKINTVAGVKLAQGPIQSGKSLLFFGTILLSLLVEVMLKVRLQVEIILINIIIIISRETKTFDEKTIALKRNKALNSLNLNSFL